MDSIVAQATGARQEQTKKAPNHFRATTIFPLPSPKFRGYTKATWRTTPSWSPSSSGTMIQPVCLRLPQDVSLAAALWKVLEEGACVRGTTSPNSTQRPALVNSAHFQVLLDVARDRLLNPLHSERVVWLERRELMGLLRVLDLGLCRIRHDDHENADEAALRAVHELLMGLREIFPTPRKPAQRQAAVAKPAAVLAGRAGGA
jgi:hypothetical protein